MYITKEKFNEIAKKYSSLLVVEGDVSEAFGFVQELLEAEADALKAVEPEATASIDRLNAAAYEIFDIQGDIENEEFLEEEISSDDLKVVQTIDELKDYLEDNGWHVEECNVGPGNDIGWELSKYSPAGEDFFFAIEHNNDVVEAIQALKQYAYNFDIDEHVQLNLGGRGAPGVVELVEDAKEIQKMLDELADGVNFCQQKTIAETIASAEAKAGKAEAVKNQEKEHNLDC